MPSGVPIEKLLRDIEGLIERVTFREPERLAVQQEVQLDLAVHASVLAGLDPDTSKDLGRLRAVTTATLSSFSPRLAYEALIEVRHGELLISRVRHICRQECQERCHALNGIVSHDVSDDELPFVVVESDSPASPLERWVKEAYTQIDEAAQELLLNMQARRALANQKVREFWRRIELCESELESKDGESGKEYEDRLLAAACSELTP